MRFDYVYAARQKNTHFCKVGWPEKNPETRCEANKEDCQMVTEATYVMPRFRHTFRAERKVHSVIYHRAKQKTMPSVRTKEWYQLRYHEVILQIQVVYSWFMRVPHDKETNKLKPKWKPALDEWLMAEEMQEPRG
jgi:hypothetical protein